MRYVSSFRRLALIGLLGGLGACAFNAEKQGWNYDGSERVTLLSTAEYLPVQVKGEDNQVLPYVAKPNPYESLTGRIERETVERYIDARRAFNARKYDFADQLLAELMESEPTLSGPVVMRGDIAMARNELAQAVEFYVSAIQINPVNFNAYLRLAKAQRMRGHFNHAQNTYARALERWPDGAEIHLNLGVLYDLYLNQALKAQAHMEAYQFLSGDNSGDVVAWLDEIRQRTGVASALKLIGSKDDSATAHSKSSETQSLAASARQSVEE